MAEGASLDDFFKQRNVTIGVDGHTPIRFETFDSLSNFVAQQIEFWKPIGGNVPFWNGLAQAQGHLGRARNAGARENPTGSIQDAISALNAERIIYSESAKAKFIIALKKRMGDETVAGAVSYFKGNLPTHVLNQRVYMQGVIAAAIFSDPDILSAGNKAAVDGFEQQRSRLDEFCTLIDGRVRAFMAEVDTWRALAHEDVQNLLEDERKTFSTQLDSWKTTYEANSASWQTEVEELRRLYEEKLRLEKPAKYWKALAVSYDKQGQKWLTALGVAVVMLVVAMGIVVYLPPSLLRSDQFTLAGFKGAVAITAGISMMIFLINTLTRLATSSLHLARDARERYQMTHVYLALIKDKAMDEEDRQTVLNALFSRSDTGLLKHDGAPELPLSAILATLKGK